LSLRLRHYHSVYIEQGEFAVVRSSECFVEAHISLKIFLLLLDYSRSEPSQRFQSDFVFYITQDSFTPLAELHKQSFSLLSSITHRHDASGSKGSDEDEDEDFHSQTE